MATPPSFSDLGQAARDLLFKGYNYGTVKMDLKTKTNNGLSISSGGRSHLATGKTNGGLELKMPVQLPHTVPFTLKGKWTTENVFHTELVIEDQIVKGSKIACETAYAPASGKKTGRVKAAYKAANINSNVDVDFNFAGPTVNGAVVLGHYGFFAGYHLAYDTASSRLTKTDLAGGYTAPDFQLYSSVTNGSDYSGSIYHKVNADLETAVLFSWTHDKDASTAPSFAIGAKYSIDKDSSIAAKINQSSALGLSYSQKLRPSVNLTLSTLVDAKNFDAGGHQVGLGLDFNF